MPNSSPVSLVIIGGGASGMAAAIAARETADSLGLKREISVLSLLNEIAAWERK